MMPHQAQHIQIPLQSIEKIYKELISTEITDDEIRRLTTELISVLSTDTVRDLINFTKEKNEESTSLQLQLSRKVFNEYDRMEQHLLSELKEHPDSMANLFPLNQAQPSDEDLLLSPKIMQKFYNARRLFTLLVDARTQDKQVFWIRWALFHSEEKRLNRAVQTPLFSTLRKEAFANENRTEFLKSMHNLMIRDVSAEIDSYDMLDDALIVCKFLMGALMTASLLSQLKIKTMSHEYNENVLGKPQLILHVNGICIDFKGKVAQYLKKLFDNPLGEFFMADFCSSDVDANKKEYDKFYRAFEGANRRISVAPNLKSFGIYPLVLIDGYSIKLNPDYAPFFHKSTKLLKYKQ